MEEIGYVFIQERLLLEKKVLGLGVVSHTCNLSYSGGEDWEYFSSRPF
jgi:hypothetical protein